jgi:hypothetical protein
VDATTLMMSKIRKLMKLIPIISALPKLAFYTTFEIRRWSIPPLSTIYQNASDFAPRIDQKILMLRYSAFAGPAMAILLAISPPAEDVLEAHSTFGIQEG